MSDISPKKKPDNVVWNEEKNKYNASLLPYGTNVSAPNITTTDTVIFLQSQSIKFNHYIDQKYQELKEELEKLVAGNSSKAFSNEPKVSTSRSFVGSSRSKRFPPCFNVNAKFKRLRSPPERIPAAFC